MLAGVTAAMIWTAIGLMVGMDTKTVGLYALILLAVGLIGTMLIATVIGRGKATKRT